VENFDTASSERAHKLRKGIQKSQPRRIWVIMNSKSISHHSMKDAENYQINGNMPN
jgi:hypothetical protein